MFASVQNYRDRLPDSVYDLALRLGARCNGGEVTFRQRGKMKDVGESRWMTFKAAQTIRLDHCAFEWRARAGPLGMIGVRDALEDGTGGLSVTALGLFVISEPHASAALTRGELLRYLAELPLAPDAILLNNKLQWQQITPDIYTVSSGDGATVSQIELTLDSDGRIGSIYAQGRPRRVADHFVLTPWRGSFSEYQLRDGRWIPARAEVGWEIDGKLDICWQGQIQDWKILPRSL